jgi:hypothetical protein
LAGLCGDVNSGSRAAAEHHLSEAREIVRRRKHSCMSGNATHVACCRIVHHAAQGRALFTGALGGGNLPAQGRRRAKHGSLHAQWQEDIEPGILGNHLTREPVHDLAKQ